jgi:hypothetical protein
MIDMEGNATIDAGEVTHEPAFSEGVANAADADRSQSARQSQSAPELSGEEDLPSADSWPLATSPSVGHEASLAMMPITSQFETMANDYGSEVPSSAYALQAQEEASAQESAAIGPQVDVNDPLGLQAYSNSEISSGQSGPILFRILISGIDTKEIRESLREALQDSRFAWDERLILSSISKGELAIENVSPVKASIVVNRIKHLPIKIRWEQNAIAQTAAPQFNQI